MRKFLTTINIMFNLFADMLYTPLVRAYLKEIAIKAPLFPGQRWTLPMIGVVIILKTDIYSVTYMLLECDDGEVYVSSRSEFVIHGRSVADSPEENDEVPKLKIIQFPLQNNKTK